MHKFSVHTCKQEKEPVFGQKDPAGQSYMYNTGGSTIFKTTERRILLYHLQKI